jgi:hypothetical protein
MWGFYVMGMPSSHPREPPEAASLYYPREPRAGLLIYLRNLQIYKKLFRLDCGWISACGQSTNQSNYE